MSQLTITFLIFGVAIVLIGVLTAERAYRGISWTTVILVAGMIPLSTAMIETGAAESWPRRSPPASARRARTRSCSGSSS